MANAQDSFELELRFARSRRRSQARRTMAHRRNPLAWRSVRAAALSLVLLAFVAESTRVEPSRANAPGRAATAVTPAHALRLDGPDPATNILAGARYLKEMLDRFDSLELGLAAYNAGPSAVERSGGAPTIQTLRYVKNIELRASQLPGC